MYFASQCLIAPDWHLTWSIFTLRSLEKQIFLALEAISLIGKCIIRALTQIFINVIEAVFIEGNHFKIAFLGSLSPWSYRYDIQLSTGIWYDSGTTANVFLIIAGEAGSSHPYQLKGGTAIPFARGSITSFTISLNNYIGPIKGVRVWHDNSGSSPSWYLHCNFQGVIITPLVGLI